jgi:hypothetical protein
MRITLTLAAIPALAAMLAWSPSVMAQQKTIKQCRNEWRANREAIAASGKTQRLFIGECRGVPVPASIVSAELEKGQYATEAEAKTSCGSDAVVWANRLSKIYHESGSKSYGATRVGAYMCEKDSIAAGFRAAKAARAAKPAST